MRQHTADGAVKDSARKGLNVIVMYRIQIVIDPKPKVLAPQAPSPIILITPALLSKARLQVLPDYEF